MTLSTDVWLWRRDLLIVVAVFLVVQWVIGFWVSPSFLPPFRSPKPVTALGFHSQSLLVETAIFSSRHSSSISKNDDLMEENFRTAEQDSFAAWRSKMDKRLQRMRKVCKKYDKKLKQFNNHNKLVFDTKHHIAYCKNSKVGTTTWLGELLEANGVSTAHKTPEEIHVMAEENFPPLPPKAAAKEMGQLALLFTVVRHPFSRLVSAYRDKIPEKYRQDLQKQMIKDYRKHENHTINGTQDPSQPTFREFALFVSNKILSCPFIINSACLDQIDVHWRPFFVRCAPCDIHYHVIAKMETHLEDQKYIKALAGLPLRPTEEQQNAYYHGHASKGPSSANLTRQYLLQLSEAEKQILSQAYFYDFQLFGYSPDVIV